jgi:hypothetical protein
MTGNTGSNANSGLEITGAWVPADGSTNHIEVAPCANPNLRAVRNSYSPNDVFYASPQMLNNFATAINSGQFRSLGLR